MNKIRVKSKMGRNEKKGHDGKHTRPKKWSGARRPAGPATTALFRPASETPLECRADSRTRLDAGSVPHVFSFSVPGFSLQKNFQGSL